MTRSALWLSLIACAAAPALAADPATIDWTKIPAASVMLFYPGQSSYEWLRSNDHGMGKGAKAAREGSACTKCHEGDERSMGASVVKSGALEPTPVKGKNGSLELKVQSAYDDKNVYLRFQWRTNADRAGTAYPSYRFDGKEWRVHGYPKLDKVVQEGKQPGIYEDRLSLMIDDGKVPNFARQGCWVSCHNGLRDMPNEISKADAQSAMKKDDVRKYLPASRSNPEDPKSVKPAEEIAKIKAAGGFADLIQWRAPRSNPAGAADDGYVLEYRNFDSGKNHFASNLDNEKKVPKLMFAPGKKGEFLISGVNAVPFDPNAGWKEGDILPGRLVSRTDAKGSAADNDAVYGTWKDRTYTLVWRRKLDTGNPADDKIMKVGGTYPVSFAVHDDNVTTRFHHVSFPLTLGIGVNANIKAISLK